MTDNITLPCAVVWRLHAAFRDADKTIRPNGEKSDYSAEIAILDAALAEPEQKPEPVAHVENGVLVRSALPKGYTGPLYAAPPEPDAKREPATEKQIVESYTTSKYDGLLYDFHIAWREAERFHGIRKEDGK